jgi:hypothetical protein
VRPAPRLAGALVVGGMQACWALALFALVRARAGVPELSPLWPAGGALLGAAAWRLTDSHRLPVRLGLRLAGGLAWTLAAGVAATPAGPGTVDAARLTAAAVTLAAWAWGCRLATVRFRFDLVLRELQLGVVVLLLASTLSAHWGVALPGMPLATFGFFLLFAGGAAAAVGQGAGRWLSAGPRGVWLLIAAANGAAVLACGLFATLAVTPEALQAVSGVLAAGWDAVCERLHSFMTGLAGLFPASGAVTVRPVGPRAAAPPQPTLFHEILRLPEWLRGTAEAATLLIWTVLLAVAVWRTVSQVAGWLRRRAAELEGAEIERVPGAFRQDLLRLLRRLRAWAKAVVEWGRARLGIRAAADAESSEAAAVRRAYRRLLAWSAAAGCNRLPAQTPHEFLERLRRWRPRAGPPLARITEHYVRVRYGGERPDAAALMEIERAWREVKTGRASAPAPGESGPARQTDPAASSQESGRRRRKETT